MYVSEFRHPNEPVPEYYQYRLVLESWLRNGPCLAMTGHVRIARGLSWVLVLPLMFPFMLLAQHSGAETKVMRAVRAATPLVIDGRLDEDVWSSAGVIEDLHQISPNEYAEPSERTVIHVLYDQDVLYVGARLLDRTPEQIVARVLRQGERPENDDSFSIVLSPFNDQRSGYFFEVNANGVRSEALYRDSKAQFDWVGIWRAASTINEDGWVTEVAIPFKSLSFDPDNDVWGINFTREVVRKQETIGWVSRSREQNPGVAGVVVGLGELDQGRGFDIVPSVSLRRVKSFVPVGSTSNTVPSLDVFYRLTPALTGILTLNTDFSATEIDDRQVNLTRFSLFFPEKRDFFLQDADIFEFGRIGLFRGPDSSNGRPFFSRTVGLSETKKPVDLQGGIKLSGRVGRWNLGMLSVRQEQFEDIDATSLFVGRVVANVFEESSLGVIVTEGDPRTNRDNSLYGVDFRYANTRLKSGRNFDAEAWYQKTDTPGLEGDDSALGMGIRSQPQEKFGAYLSYKQFGKNYNPALGFLSRPGDGNFNTSVYYTYRPQESYLRTIRPRITLERFERLVDGSVDSESITLQPFQLTNHTGDAIQLDLTRETEGLIEPFEISDGIIIAVGEYKFHRQGVTFSSGAQRKFSGEFSYSEGDFFGGEKTAIEANFNWRPSARFRLNAGYAMDDIKLPEGSFVSRLTRFRVDVVFSSKLSWVNLIQWDNVSNSMGINSRFHWIPEAGREIFLVLNHNLQAMDGNRNFRSKAADFTVKANYTFRF